MSSAGIHECQIPTAWNIMVCKNQISKIVQIVESLSCVQCCSATLFESAGASLTPSMYSIGCATWKSQPLQA